MFDPLINPLHPPTVTKITDDVRERAKKATIAKLRELDEIRKHLEIPVEQLPMVREIYEQQAVLYALEDARTTAEARRCRVPLTIMSKDDLWRPLKVPPGKTAIVVARPQWQAFRVEDVEIHGDRSRWKVHDIKVGTRSQFVNHEAPASGTAFGPGGVLAKLRLETCQIGMHISMVIEYVGPEPDGETFEATFSGLAIES